MPALTDQLAKVSGLLKAFNELPADQQQKLVRPYVSLATPLIAAFLAPRALSRLSHRARDAGFDVPPLTIAEARGLWRPAALLLTLAAFRAAGGARMGRPDPQARRADA